jgi:hypothetical protein
MRIFKIVSVATVFAMFPLAATAQEKNPKSSVPVEKPTDTNIEQYAPLLAKSEGISIEDARSALLTSGLLYDFQEKFKDEPAFGAAYATYDDGYQMKVRLTEESASIDSAIDELERSAGRKVQRSVGGASYSKIESFKLGLREYAGKHSFATQTDYSEGTVTLQSDNAAFADMAVRGSADFVRIDVSAPRKAKPKNFAGADKWTNYPGTGWSRECTWAGNLRNDSTGQTLAATAGHCDDHQSWANGYIVSLPVNEECSSWRDIQYHFYQSTPTIHPIFPSANYAPWYWVRDTGGAAPGQTLLIVGATSRETAPGNGAIVTTFNRYDWVEIDSTDNNCGAPTEWSLYGPVANSGTLGGDSGGLMTTLYYNGSTWDYYMLGIVSAGDDPGPGTETVGTYAGWAVPPGWRWCTQVSPC